MTDTVRVALVGLGRMGRLHAKNMGTRCPSVELVAVLDANAELAAAVADELRVPRAASFDDLLTDPSVDAIAVATPTASHAELSVRAARAGKHVFSEKPIALDRATTLATVEEVETTGVAFQVGFHRRFDPDWVTAAERIQAGKLGAPYLFRTSLRDMASPPVAFLAHSGGFFVDVTIHDLDTARWLVGEVVEVCALGAALSDPAFAAVGDIDTAVVTLRFENGALGVIDNSRSAGYGYECSTEIMGSRATVRIDNPVLHHVEWRTPGAATYELVRDFEQRYPLAYALEIESFARCVLDGAAPRATGRDALAAFDLASAAELSFRAGRPVATRPRRTASGIEYEIDAGP